MDNESKLFQVNSEHLKKLQLDPVAQFLETVAKLSFVCNLPPTLNKDMRVIQIENFYRANFTNKQNG